MIRSERMQTVAGLARDEEGRAASAMAEQRRRCEEQAQRLAELQQFQREYMERFQALGKDGIGIEQINQYRRFNDRLSEAIAQQTRVAEEARNRLEQQNAAWMETYAKRRALDNTVARFRADEAVHAGRKEQHEADERAQRPRLALE